VHPRSRVNAMTQILCSVVVVIAACARSFHALEGSEFANGAAAPVRA
jgi:hypothetical protein